MYFYSTHISNFRTNYGMGLVQNANQASRQDLAAREGGQKPEEGAQKQKRGPHFQNRAFLITT